MSLFWTCMRHLTDKIVSPRKTESKTVFLKTDFSVIKKLEAVKT